MNSRFGERILTAAPEYLRLANIINPADHAPRELTQQRDLINTLKSEITASDARVASAEAKRLAEQADHTKYQNSTFRRFAHKASGQSSKYAAKAEKKGSMTAANDALTIATHLDTVSERDNSHKIERAALATLDAQLVSTRVSYLQTQRAKNEPEDIPVVEVDQTGIMKAMYFAAPSLFKKGRTECEGIVRQLSEKVLKAGLFVKAKVEQGVARKGELRGEIQKKEKELKVATEKLVRVRKDVCESVTGEKT
ncbi:hypothetical protein B0T14DRAFT_560325 [Immersiella caudata]|uniref:Uncharacterized protein n=1 Tax=Immersiella caudata TaxID=314043 RepID=A0AA39XFF9_9PEZI|nr:hypothetical protein B0T14DRAFT_560325 [Immersiella caudata]